LAEHHQEAREQQEDLSKFPARSPWWFVPSLYFMQGLPVMIVQGLSTVLYTTMGVPTDQIGLFTALISLPWVLKLLWGPLVDHYATKRTWIVSTQAVIIALLIAVGFSMHLPMWLVVSLVVFGSIAFASATHDIAADGFYMLSMPQDRQAWFVGIRSACFRLATIFTTGVLVAYAGSLQLEWGIDPARIAPGVAVDEATRQYILFWVAQSWFVALLIGAGAYTAAFVYGLFALPRPPLDLYGLRTRALMVAWRFAQILITVAGIGLAWRLFFMALGAVLTTFSFIPGWPLRWEHYFANFGLPLYTERLGQGAEMFDVIGRGTPPFFVTHAEGLSRLWYELPISLTAVAMALVVARSLFRGIGLGPAAREFFTQNRIFWILAFILFYRFGESMIATLSGPFLLRPTAVGGLGIDTETTGYMIGTIGVVALTVGGLLGGFLIAKHGLRKCFWPMVLSMNVPNLMYLWAAWALPASPLSEVVRDTAGMTFFQSLPYRFPAMLQDPVALIITIDQFGFGFGFAAYLVYLLFICQDSRIKTSLYAIATGLMALGAMIARISSGYIHTAFTHTVPEQSFFWFFVAVCALTIPGMITLLFIPMEKKDLKVRPVDVD
jgi:PAT family beta-lactamase induction signal transducer AmpG